MRNIRKYTKNSVTREVIAYTGKKLTRDQKDIVEEIRLELFVNKNPAGEMICSPWEIQEAVTGYLYMKEYVHDIADIKKIIIDQKGHSVFIETADIQKEGTSDILSADDSRSLSVCEIMDLSQKLEEMSGLFHRTGGVHCAAFVRDTEFLSYKEDVSRHVAVDKVVGDCLIRGIPMGGGILVFSGRVPAEILKKVAAMGCMMVIAKSAPTNYSCDLAQKLGITLIGFARDSGFNIYSHPERIFEADCIK